jgi:membrane protease subunit HflC
MNTLRTPAFFLLSGIIVLALIAFSFTYTVPFNERAVVTRFGSASAEDVQDEPGLKFKLPYPFQSVTSYDTRLRLVDLPGTQQQTADENQIVVEAFALWRVSDPLKFYQKFSNAGASADDHFAQAERTVRSSLNSAVSETSRFRLDELFTTAESGSKLPELESAIQRVMEQDAGAAGTEQGLGIEIVDVGINRVRLTEKNSEDVITRMKADRERLANDTISQGNAAAQSIRSKADADAARIRSFANRLAGELRSTGDQEAGQFIAQMNESSELALLLAELDFLRESFGKQVTLVVSGAPGLRMAQPTFVDTMTSAHDADNDAESNERRAAQADGGTR